MAWTTKRDLLHDERDVEMWFGIFYKSYIPFSLSTVYLLHRESHNSSFDLLLHSNPYDDQ